MVISKCPLRISLVGGSTDLESYLEAYSYGSVISFPCDLYTYITINFRKDEYYQISYSSDEYVKNPDDIVNDVAREVIRHFNLPPVTICFNADIPSTGSGLASSSSYLIGLISGVSTLLNLSMSQTDVCKLALKLERSFNPLTGYQDPYGCGVGGFKRIGFKKTETEIDLTFQFLDASILTSTGMYLVPTAVTRSSSNILNTVDVHKSRRLLEDVEDLHQAIQTNNSNNFWKIINKAWLKKKETSTSIVTDEIGIVESTIKQQCPTLYGLKLCGAGGGGYFLVFSDTPVQDAIKITIDNLGIRTWTI